MASQSDAVYSSSSLPSQPLSPWAQRFKYNAGSRWPLIQDDEIHSGLAPEQPKLHPKYYADEPDSRERLAEPTTLQQDTVFLSERFQRTYLKGLESWQAGPLMRYVWFSDSTGLLSGGHQAADYENVQGGAAGERKIDVALKVFNKERIQVDESKWFTFLRKDRWFDLVKREPILGGSNWSVDNPKVWDVLSISLELLDRMLKAMIADKHVMIETILFGLITDWDQASDLPIPFQGAHVLLSRIRSKSVCYSSNVPCALDYVDQYFNQDDWTARLETLMATQEYSFIDRFDQDSTTWGVTVHSLHAFILTDVAPLKNLIHGDITLSERCMLHFIVATTILHEMFHALHKYRKIDTSWPENLPPINWFKQPNYGEPLVDFDATNEMGFAAEQRIFGGQLILGPLRVMDLPLGVYREQWPNPILGPGEEVDENHPSWQKGAKLSNQRVTALYASRLLSTQFWETPFIPNKSENHFHFTNLFQTESLYCGEAFWQSYRATALTQQLPPSLLPGDVETIVAWHDRYVAWFALRDGWYNRDLVVWGTTPWSAHQHRQSILAFGRAFARKDEVECATVAVHFIQSIRWEMGKNFYLSKMPPKDQDHQPWIFHTIGLLMAAAIPIRQSEASNPREFPQHIAKWQPSQAAEAARNPSKKKLTFPARPVDDRRVGRSELWDPMDSEDEIFDFGHEDYLGLAESVIKHLADSGVEVSAPWLREITKTLEDLRQQRRDPGMPTQDLGTWAASWDFVIPAYNNTISKFINGSWAVQMVSRSF
ncbi:hypothetical protein F4678DRAFT_480306 [Xylaria arbuscula]|nr:hypothetical protein F4678DRAFT_480306 [Xylaria arbuscula]